MNPAMIVPSPDPIPVPAAWFQVLLPATFLLHLLFMNTVLGCATIALVNRLRNRSHPEVAADLSKKLPTSLALAVNLGVPPLLFLQVIYGNCVYASSILMAGWWLSVSGVLIIGYYGLYVHDSFRERSGGLGTLALGLSVLLLLYTSFMLTNNMSLMINPAKWTEWFNRPDGSILNLTDPTLIPRWLHFVTASLAVGGLFVALIGRMRDKSVPGSGAERVALGLKWFTRSTMAAMCFGLWWLLALQSDILLGFMGRDVLSTLFLFCGVALALAALVTGLKGGAGAATLLTVAAMAFMVLVRDAVRRASLKPFHTLDAIPVHPDYSSLILFLLATVLAAPVAVWMIKLHLRAVREG